MDKIIQVDISILDKEIETLKSELQKKTALRDYIQSLAKSTPPNSSTTKTTTPPARTNSTAPTKTSPAKTSTITTAPVKEAPVKTATKKAAPKKAVSATTVSKTAPQKTATAKPLGLTEFILDYLKKNPKSESKPITNAFIKASDNKSLGVKANVANTLSRLRKEGKLKVQNAPSGPGFLWSVK